MTGPHPTHITIDRAADLPAEELAAIHRWLIEVFEPGEDELYRHTDAYVRVWHGDQWVSLVEIVEVTITVGGQPLRIGGIGGVSTFAAFRRRGYSSAALREAARYLFDVLGAEFGVLFCDRHRIPFYERLGWRLVEQPFRFTWKRDQPPVVEDHFMVLERPGTHFPPGEPDFGGPLW